MDIKITKTTAPKAKPQKGEKLGFGHIFTDHMFVMNYTEGKGWHDARIEPYRKIELDRKILAIGRYSLSHKLALEHIYPSRYYLRQCAAVGRGF